MKLQKLLENQLQKKAVGTLTLGKQQGFREVFFEAESVYLIGQSFSGRVATDGLARLGIPGKLLGRNEFESAIQSTDLKHRLLCETLLAGGIIDEEQFAELVAEQLSEELLDLFFRCSSSFHFQEGRVPEYLLECEHLLGRTPLPLGELLQELRWRQARLMEIETILPSRDEVFVFTEKGLAFKQKGDPDYAVTNVLALADGFRDLRRIVEDAQVHEFRTLSVVTQALEQGYVKKTIFPELRGISTQNLDSSNALKYLPFFKNAVLFGVDELSARERLAVVLEKAGDVAGATAEYERLGDALQRMRKPSKAIKAYQHALGLSPSNDTIKEKASRIYIEAAQEEIESDNRRQAAQLLEGALRMHPEDPDVFGRLLDVLIRTGDLKEISRICDWLASRARKQQDPGFAIQACQRVIQELPQTPVFRKRLINLYLDCDRPREAAAQMEKLAAQYLERKQPRKAQALLEKLQRVSGGSWSNTQLLRKIETAAAPPAQRCRKRNLARHAVLALVFAVLVYQVFGFVAWHNLRSRSAEAEEKTSPAVSSPLAPGREELKEREVAQVCTQFLEKFPLHVLRLRVARLRDSASTRAGRLRSRRERLGGQKVEDARRALAEGKKDKAGSLVKDLLGLDADSPHYREALELQVQVPRCAQSAQALLRAARAAELAAVKDPAAARWKEAFAAYRLLLRTYPRSQLVRNLEVPVWVDSLPRGAVVREIVGFERPRVLGKTPLICRLLAGESMSLQLEARHYAPLQVSISETGGGAPPPFRLARLPDYTWDLDGAAYEPPVIVGGKVLCGTSAGSFSCFDMASGKALWTWTIPGGNVHRMLTPPLVAENGIYTAWSDTWLRCFRLEKQGNDARSWSVKSKPESVRLRGLPTTRCHLVSGSPIVVLGTTAGELESHDLRTLEFRGTVPLSGHPTTIAPLSDNCLLVGTREGTVFKVFTRTWGSQVLSRKLGEIEGLAASGKFLAVRTVPETLQVWTLAANGKPSGAPLRPGEASSISFLPQKGTICLITPGGKLRLIRLGTEEAIEREIGPDFSSLVPLGKSIGVLGNQGHSLLLVDANSLEPTWWTRTQATITSVGADDTHVAVCVAVEGDGQDPKGRLLIHSLE